LDGELDRPLLIDAEHRSPDPSTCPFLRAVDAGDRLGLPVEAVDPRNRCVATGGADPQDAAQQRMACLTASHVSCPRYLSGVAGPTLAPLVAAEAAIPGPGGPGEPGERAAARATSGSGRGARTLTPAVIAATVFLVASASAAIAFVALRGGIDLPIASPRASEVALASPTAAASAEPSSVPTTPGPASPSPSLAETPAPTPTPASTSDRYALLEPCPSTPDCYVYEIRAGDNLRSIANYFGVSYETVLQMNPQISDPATIQPGDEIRLPPPTR
jgi:LysM repeat protein